MWLARLLVCWPDTPPGYLADGGRDHSMITEDFVPIATKSIHQDKSLRDHDGTADAVMR
jgi:hypothetical protein